MSRQFDVFHNPLRAAKEERPFVIVIQSDRIDSIGRVCAPLFAERFLKPFGRLNPQFVVLGQSCYFHPVELLTLPVRVLRDPVANLDADRDRLVAAIDLVFTDI
jgi:hypothetical protein